MEANKPIYTEEEEEEMERVKAMQDDAFNDEVMRGQGNTKRL